MIARILIILFLFVSVSHSTIYTAPVVGGGGSAYILEETFEGVENGYDNSGWIETDLNGAVDPDYTTSPAPLEGSESLLFDAVSGYVELIKNISDTADIYMCFSFRFENYADPGFTFDWFFLEESDGTDILNMEVNTTGLLQLRLTTGVDIGATDMADCSGASEWCTIWIERTKGTGSDETGKVYLKASTVSLADSKIKPASDDSMNITNSTSTADVGKFKFWMSHGWNNFIIDGITVDDEVIGNCP